MTRITADWLEAPATQAVTTMLVEAGHRVFFVGGCVRNALLGREVTDLDLATDARPERVMALAEGAGLRAVPTGLAHGTVTVVSAGRAFEITTFRRDVATDGRHAVVAYTDDIAADAARRDFTMNALYADPDGWVADPIAGLADLRAGRVRFVGEPEARISEDYLRILRFFRFHAWYGTPGAGLDADGMSACAALQQGLARISRERIGSEIAKLLAAPDPAASVAAMAASGILARVLPGADATALAPLVHLERVFGADTSWLRRLATLGPAKTWTDSLRLGRADLSTLRETARAGEIGHAAEAAYRCGPDAARDAALIGAAQSGVALRADLAVEIARGARARFPLHAQDLPHAGPALGQALRRLEAAWVASDFTLDRHALRALDTARAAEEGHDT